MYRSAPRSTWTLPVIGVGVGATPRPAATVNECVVTIRRHGPVAAEGPALNELLSTVNIPVVASLALDPTAFPGVAHVAQPNGSNAWSPRPMEATDYVQVLEEAMQHAA